ncbi:hypothetical protein [Urechidicola vernalis]|uniref:Uncharacterized protein n=1 Tax=Urechidicola vernalis TaxID=3075600 RepID=A0ABU2Y2N0_9FLAO|nr:hypothetical protein [Urechidicola sp. P050]MDT0551894.1 hypothetical protein [Urechidicola sp. P050]
MIKLFNKPRRKALAESRLGKYLVYAIGEILLVVVGILIALQINTSRQEYNQNQKTRTYLISLNTEIQLNISRLNSKLEAIQEDIENSAKDLEALNSPEAFKFDELKIRSIMDGTRPIYGVVLSTSTFEDLINSGVLEYLHDEKLKHDILKIGSHVNFIDENSIDAQHVWDEYQQPYLMKYSAVATNWDSLNGVKISKTKFTRDKEAFIQNRDYSNILALRMRMQTNYFETCDDIKKILEKYSVAINAYLNQ